MANKAGRMVRCPQCGVLYDNTRYVDHRRTAKHRAAERAGRAKRGKYL